MSSLDQVTVGMAMTYEGTRNRDTGKIVAERVEFSNNDLEDGEARLWRSLSPSVRPSQALKPAELRISGVGRFKLLPNDEVQEYIAEVGERLIPAYQRALPANDPRKIPFKFFVVQDEDVNAFALANGTVVVKSGLLEALDNEAQLAAVVGHEIAHSTHEHTWRQEQFHKKKRVGIAIAGAVAAAYGWRDLAELATLVNAAIVNGYGRSLENQADRLGLQYMVAAGYDPREAASVWKLFARKFGDQATDVFWSSHDNHSTRRSYLMNELKNNYRQLDYSQLTAARDRYAVMRSAMVSGKTSKVRIAVTAPVPSSRSASVGPPKPVDVSTVRTVAPSPTPLPAPTLRVDPPKTAVTAIPASALVRTYQPMVERPDLPNIDGLTPAQVKIFLGPPAYTQVLRDKRLAWSYATPDGERTIYFKPESAASQRSKAAASSSSPPTADIAPDACDGVVALTGVRSITVRSPRSPVFSTPQLRQDALRLFAARTVLPVLELDGPWYVVRWQGDRGPQAGYLHCSDATVYALTP